jgi:DNA topoisomerase I
VKKKNQNTAPKKRRKPTSDSDHRAKKSLIIVESPSKARTINKYVGKEYSVMGSMGHVKDLPKKRLGIAVDEGFRPEYVVISGKNKILGDIKRAAGKADKIYLAPDPDREGEAIAYHIFQELDGDSERIYRVLFNEITEQGIREAMDHPGKIDLRKVNAQQARRVLDRIVGYKLSPLLWEKVRRGLSAGRVQSVAVRLVCEREKEREAFVSEEYWSIMAQLEGSHPPAFDARLVEFQEQAIKLSNEKKTKEVLKQLRNATYTVKQIEKKDRKRNPLPPFITSRLQQDASRKLRFSAKKTMMIAQQLYEGVELGQAGPVGLITYMRTDSTRMSKEAIDDTRHFIRTHFGDDYVPSTPRSYPNKKGAQDAHEAIRPTSIRRTPESVKPYIGKDQYELYKLIWYRLVACQMEPAQLEQTRVDIQAGDYVFRATGSVVKFAGFTALYTEAQDEKPGHKVQDSGLERSQEEEEEKELPVLSSGERLSLLDLSPKQHFTQPPPRYTEALLIKDLEEKGIGRPSTYHTILSTILDRKYAEKEAGRFRPTDLGSTVNELLVEHFPDLLNIGFTARMENELDEIEEGEKQWVETVQEFYGPFTERLSKAQREMREVKREEIPTEIVCERCGRHMVIKWGRHGRFLACPGYPECKNTKEFVQEAGEVRVVEKHQEVSEKCPECQQPLVIKKGKYGRFLACSNYPNCKFTKALGTGVHCTQPDCGGELIEKRTRRGKLFYGCNRYPKCTFALWDRPIPQSCPLCSAPFLIEKFTKRAGRQLLCLKKECGYQESQESPDDSSPHKSPEGQTSGARGSSIS